MNELDVWGASLDRRIAAYNEQRALVERQFAEIGQAKAGLDVFGRELQAEIEAFQSAKRSQKPSEPPYRTIPPLRQAPAKVPVISQETPQGELPDEESFFGEEVEDEVPEPPKPVGRPPLPPRPQPVVSTTPPEPVKGAFDSKALFARLK